MFLRCVSHIANEAYQAIPYVPNRSAYPDRSAALQWSKLWFLREVAGNVFSTKTQKYNPCVNNISELYYNILSALFAEYSQTGACGEMAGLTLEKLLRHGIAHSIEIVTITDQKNDNNHCFLVLNRDPKTNLNNPKSWGTFILVDTWLENCEVSMYNKNRLLREEKLKNHVVEKISSITQDLRIEGELHPQVWEQICVYLNESKKMASQSMIQDLIDEEDLMYVDEYYTSSQRIHEDLQQKFTQAISHFEKLAEKSKQTYCKKKIDTSTMLSSSNQRVFSSGNGQTYTGALFQLSPPGASREIKEELQQTSLKIQSQQR